MGFQDYISRLANGLDTKISQNTSSVSGGQAQIIAFLRAMLFNRDIIILDEPVANVDTDARDLVINALKAPKYGGILIVISHQIEGLEFLDRTIQI